MLLFKGSKMINQGWKVRTIKRRFGLSIRKNSNNQICPNMEQNPLGGRKLSKHRLDDYVAEM